MPKFIITFDMTLRLKEILKERKLSITKFSSMVGISQSNLSNYINGNISPKLETLEKIADCLGIEVTELFRRKEDFEILIRYNGVEYPITSSDIRSIINKKENNEHRPN